MENLSLNLIFEDLSPIFKRLKTITTASALMMIPFTVPSQSIQHIQHNIDISSIKDTAVTRNFNNKLNKVMTTIEKLSSRTDYFINSLTSEKLRTVKLQDILNIELEINQLDLIIKEIIDENRSISLSSELKKLSKKMHLLCDMMKSEKYKQQSDEVLLSRSYQGEDSVGYTYNPEHSFDDFKKSIKMG